MTNGSPQMPRPGDVFAGSYEIIDVAGVGGYAKVFRAHAAHLDGDVAVKVLDPELDEAAMDAFLKRFYREALLTSVLSHPNTVTPIDYGRTDEGLAYIVMEYLEGESVAEVIDRGGEFTIDKAARIVANVLESLEEAHIAGIVHSDIKASNIFLQKGNPAARVLDFGVASLIDDNDEDANQVFGTPHYIAPESAVGNAVTAAADIYSLGITAYELVYRKLPFVADDSRDVLKAHVLTPMPELHKELAEHRLGQFIRMATAKSPAIRPNAREALDVLTISDPSEDYPTGTPRHGLDTSAKPPRQTPRGSTSLRMNVQKTDLIREQVRAMRRGQTAYQMREAFTTFSRTGGGTVLLRGERGVGKERLIRELIATGTIGYGEDDVLFMDVATCRTASGRVDIAMLLEQMPRRFENFQRLEKPAQQLAREIRRNYNDEETLSRFVELLFRIGKVRPIVWVINAFEQADAQVAKFISMLLDRLSREPAQIIVTIAVSQDEPIFSRPVSYLLRNLGAGAWKGTRTIHVPPVSDPQMRALVESVEPMAPSVVDMLVRYAEGNPGRMMWLLRTARQRRLLRVEHGRLVPRLRADFGRLRDESEQNHELRERLRHVLEEEDILNAIVALSFLGDEIRGSVAGQFCRRLAASDSIQLREVLQSAMDRNILSSRREFGEEVFTFHHHPAIRSLQSLLSQDQLDRYTLNAACVLDTVDDDQAAGQRAAQLFSRASAHDRSAFAAARAGARGVRNRDFASALEMYTLAYAEMQTAAIDFDPEFATRVEINLGRARLETGAIGAAHALLLEACARAEGVGNDQMELEAHLLLSEIAVIRGDGDSVRGRVKRMLSLARASDDPELYGRALLLVGKYSRRSGQKKKGAKFFMQAEKIAAANELGLLRAQARMGIARIFAEEGLHERAEQLMQEAIRFFRGGDHQSRLIEALIELGNVRLSLGRSADALFRDAERLAEEHGHGRMLADILAGRGSAMAQGGEYDAACIILLRAIERYRGLGNVRGEGATLLALARATYSKGQLEAARTYASEAIDSHQRARDASGYTESLLFAAEVAVKRGSARDGIDYSEKALARLSDGRADARKQIRAMVLLGKAYRHDEQVARAQGVLTRALALAESSGEREYAEAIRGALVTTRRR